MLRSQEDLTPLPPLWPSLVVCAIAAVLIDLGTIHLGWHADSLIFVHISLYRWTPFFWESDRVGSLVPLLALPFSSPLTNLLVQGALYIWFYLVAFVLLTRYTLRTAVYPIVAFVGATAFILLTPPIYRSEVILCTYGVWLTLGLAALIIIEPRAIAGKAWMRFALALVLMIFAHWSYCTAIVYFAPVVFFRWLLCVRFPENRETAASSLPTSNIRRLSNAAIGLVCRVLDRELVVPMLLLLLGCGAGLVIREIYMYPANVEWGTLPVDQWSVALNMLLLRTRNALTPLHWPLFLAVITSVGLVLQLIPQVRKQSGPAVRAAIALSLTALVLVAFLMTRRWVQINHYVFRYLAPPLFFLQGGLVILGMVPILAALRMVRQKLLANFPASKRSAGTAAITEAFRRVLAPGSLGFAIASAALLVCAIHSYGSPSRGAVRRYISKFYPTSTGVDLSTGIQYEDVIDGKCTHIAGHYWYAWPVVLATNSVLHERGENRIVWGVSLRDSLTRELWNGMPLSDIRVAVLAGGDPGADHYLKRAGFPPMEFVEHRKSIWILRPKVQPVARSAPAPQQTFRDYVAQHEERTAIR